MIHAFSVPADTTGMSSHATGFLGALQKLEPVALHPWGTGTELDPSDPCLGIGSIEQMALMPGTRRHAFVVWEATVFPKNKLKILQSLEELWVPSHWGRAILLQNGLPAEKVWVVPEGVDAQIFRPLPKPAQADRPFRFLCVGKWENRKNIGQLVEAYAQEFRPEERVELVLHCFNAYQAEIPLEEKVGNFAGPRHATIRISPKMAAEQMPQLYNDCDAFVLPTRAEGWGLPILEAMSCGLPVIATHYSAHTDFLNQTNGYPLRVAEMVDIYDPYFYPSTWDLGQWAQPDSQDLRRLLRHVFVNREEARRKGELARTNVEQRWTWDHAAAIAYRRLRPERFAPVPLRQSDGPSDYALPGRKQSRQS